MSLKRSSLTIASILLLSLALSVQLPAVQAQTVSNSTWQDSDLKLPVKFTTYCMDGLQPGKLLVSVRSLGDIPVGIYEYNLKTGQSSLLCERAFSHCSPANGLLFDISKGVEGAVRFSRREPRGQPLQYAPTEIAADGTLRLYALTSRRLYTSLDADITWQEAGLPYQGQIEAISMSQADSRAIYLLTRERPAKGEYIYTIQASLDAGRNWEQRRAYRLPETSDIEITAGLGRAG